MAATGRVGHTMNNSKTVLVPHFMTPAGLEVLRARADVRTVVYPSSIAAEPFRALVREASGVALSATRFGPAEADAAPLLEVVARIGVGFDAVEIPALTRRRIPLMIAGTANSTSGGHDQRECSWREGVARLADGRDQRHDARHVGPAELRMRDQGRQRRPIAEPEPEQYAADQHAGQRSARQQDQRTDRLHRQVGRRDRPPARARGQHPPQRRPPHDCARGGQADDRPGDGLAQPRRQQREELHTRPICAINPNVVPAINVAVRRSRSAEPSGAASTLAATALCNGTPPSGCEPLSAGPNDRKRPARIHIVASSTAATSNAALPMPNVPINATHSGEKITPPMLAPLNAMPSAAGRRRSNHGETIALIAAPLVNAQPAPLNGVAKKSCHGSHANPHPTSPMAVRTAPARVTRATPKRRCSLANLATNAAPSRKCKVMAAETSGSDQPWASCSAPRKIGGP